MLLLEDRRFYVYVYLDPRKPGKYKYGKYEFDYEPFYVGSGHYGRKFAHLDEANKTKKNSLKLNKIRKIIKSGTNPIIQELQKSLTQKESLKIEEYLIDSIGRINKQKGPLTNIYLQREIVDVEKIRTSNKRRKMSDLLKEKLRKAHLGVKLSKERREHMSKMMTGKKKTKEHLAKLLGRKRSLESKEKMKLSSKKRYAREKELGIRPIKTVEHKLTVSEAMKKFFKSDKGKESTRIRHEKVKGIFKHTDEAKRKISEANKKRTYKNGYHLSQEHRDKISIANKNRISAMKGKYHSEETKQKISKGNKHPHKGGWHHTDITKKKISEANKKRIYKKEYKHTEDAKKKII